MRGPEEWPSHRSNPADRIRLTGPAATFIWKQSSCWLDVSLASNARGSQQRRVAPTSL